MAKRASDFWGIDFATVSPMNEATAPWWIPDGTQEGCHFSRGAKDQAAVLLQRALELEGFSAKGIDASGTLNQPSPVIAAFDENSYDDALRAWTMMSTAAKQFVGQVRMMPCLLAFHCMKRADVGQIYVYVSTRVMLHVF